ncbi:MAG: hypothetical protein N3G80_02135 [Candidatus Micrarchaeota archaeon]|nr:hypothetical protein [Candidatus Micrarchaeota archaeon]
MEIVFECPLSNKEKLKAILEADPYGQISFSRNGYKLKDGQMIGQDPQKCYLFIRATDEFLAFAKEKLKGIVSEAPPSVAAEVSKKIQEEENNAEIGFGSIFGQ